MSYTVDGDGKVTFRCQGKECGKTKESRSLKVLPKKWCLSAVLVSEASPEYTSQEAAAAYAKETQVRLLEANRELAGHFCSFKCAKRSFEDPRVVAMVKKLRVAVVVYGESKLVIDAESMDDGDGRDDDEAPAPRRPGGGSRDDEDDAPRGDQPKGLDRPSSPPPFTLPESSSPGF
jgi:hypothetical protein